MSTSQARTARGGFSAPDFRLDGKTALITGASRGIGLASAYALASAGAEVLIVAREEEKLQRAVHELGQADVAVRARRLDVTDPRAIETVISSEGSFDILLNNAGGNRPGLLSERTSEDIAAVLQLNVTSTLLVSKAVIAGMIKAARGGSIINLSSQYGMVGAPERTIYSAAKHGIEGLTKSLAWEVGAYGIRVNAVAPSMIETDMTQARLADAAVRAQFAAKSALGRIGYPADITGAIVFLASDASSYVTGTVIRVDGGTTAV